MFRAPAIYVPFRAVFAFGLAMLSLLFNLASSLRPEPPVRNRIISSLSMRFRPNPALVSV